MTWNVVLPEGRDTRVSTADGLETPYIPGFYRPGLLLRRGLVLLQWWHVGAR